jgi:hypothetical protein
VPAVVLAIGCARDDAMTDPSSSSSSSSSSAGIADASTGETSSDDGGESETTAAIDESSSDSESSTGDSDEPLPECPQFARGVMSGIVMSREIVEASGLATSRTHADVLWVHNDSGDAPRTFAIASDGSTLAEIAIDVPIAVDWEDMALGPGPGDGVDFLYFGDIGDNGEIRANITIHRVSEPDPSLGDATITDVTSLVLEYPDDSHNAETLLSDPTTGDLFVVTKAESGMSIVFRAAFPHDDGATIELESVAEIAFGSDALPGSPLATGGDIAADGSLVAIRTYGGAYGWRRQDDATIAEALATDPCPLPTVAEPQAEALAFGPAGYFTLSEGATQPIWFFAGA